MHKELFQQLTQAITNNKADDIADAAPRGNAKSTIVSFALPIWCAVFKKKHYIIIISDTASQADDFLGNIKAELEENDLLIDDFGSQIGLVWTNSDIITSNDVRIQSLGAGKKIRGRRYKQYRPDLIIADDLENDESVQSPEQRQKTHDWYVKALAKAGDERTDKIVVGTVLHYDSLLSKLLKNPIYQTRKYQSVLNWSNSSKWSEWEGVITNLADPDHIKHAHEFFLLHQKEMLEGTKVLWPEKENYYNLMIQRIADGPAAFSSEKQNEPLTEEDRRFQPSWISYYDDEEIMGRQLYVVGYIDPSMGKIKGDYSAIVIIGADPNGQIYVLAADMKKRHPDIIIDDALALFEIYRYKVMGVEEVQFQELFKDNFKKKIQETKSNFVIKGVKVHSDKILRIESLQPDVKNARIKFKRNQQMLIEQLINFPSADHDDGPDALEGAMRLLGQRSAIAQFYKEQAHEAQKISPQSFINNPGLVRLGQAPR